MDADWFCFDVDGAGPVRIVVCKLSFKKLNRSGVQTSSSNFEVNVAGNVDADADADADVDADDDVAVDVAVLMVGLAAGLAFVGLTLSFLVFRFCSVVVAGVPLKLSSVSLSDVVFASLYDLFLISVIRCRLCLQHILES